MGRPAEAEPNLRIGKGNIQPPIDKKRMMLLNIVNRPSDRGSGPKNVIFSNGPKIVSE